MVQPSAALGARLRFTTKSVGRGFYRGNRTGSMGAHTPYGGYLIDWRKTRNYNVPDLTDFKLTPYVSREIGSKQAPDIDEQDNQTHIFSDSDDNDAGLSSDSISRLLSTGENKLKKDLMKHLIAWRKANPDEFAQRVEEQFNLRTQTIEASNITTEDSVTK